METILCTKHKDPCFLKTGLKPGPCQGKCFYVCSHQDSCGFVQKADQLSSSECPHHHGNLIDLQAVFTGKSTGEKRQYYRCKGRDESTHWCGYVKNQVKEKPLQDYNYQDKEFYTESKSKTMNQTTASKEKTGVKPEDILARVEVNKKEDGEDVIESLANLSIEAGRRGESEMSVQEDRDNSNDYRSQKMSKLKLKKSTSSSQKVDHIDVTCKSHDQKSHLSGSGDISGGEKVKSPKTGNLEKESCSKYSLNSDKSRVVEKPKSPYSQSESKTRTESTRKSTSPAKNSPKKVAESLTDFEMQLGSAVLIKSSKSPKTKEHRIGSKSPSKSQSDESSKMKTFADFCDPKSSSKKETESDIPLSERIRLKSGDSHKPGWRSETTGMVRMSSNSSIGSVSSPTSDRGDNDIIDLTSDDEDRNEQVDSRQKPSRQDQHQLDRGALNTAVQPVNQMSRQPNPISGAPFQTASQFVLEREMEARKDLVNQLIKKKQLISTVKMSSLPDKGEKLRSEVDKIQHAITEIDQRVAKFKNSGASTTKPATVQSSQPPQPQVIKVYPNGQVVTNSQNATTVTTGQTSVNGQQTFHIVRPGIGSGQPQIVKVNQGSAMSSGVASGQPQMIRFLSSGSGNASQPMSVHVPHNPQGLKQTSILPHTATIPPHILQQLYAANPQAMQLYGGRMTAQRLREVGSVTKEAIEKLHKQLETCPAETDELCDPSGLKVPLMTHQRQALSWLVWRESQHPSGGILADDMGLGKTLTMISLILKQREARQTKTEDEKDTWHNREKQLEKLGKSVVKSNATLIICPASLVHHWHKEIERRCRPGLLKVLMYHGSNREQDVLKIADHDIVLTTYNLIGKEVGAPEGGADEPVKDEPDQNVNQSDETKPKEIEPNLLRIAWERIILDEGHNIKNHKSLTARSVSRLRAGVRFAMTGTPIQNELLDIYSLLRFLRCSPFDEYKVWKKQVDTGKATGHNRLNVLVKSLLLRRTKSQTGKEGKPLVPLPSKKSDTCILQLSSDERKVYDKVFSQSKSVMQDYVRRHEEKELGYSTTTSSSNTANPFKEKVSDNSSGYTSGQSQTYGAVSAGQGQAKSSGQQILVLLLRLRQCCSHLSLMKDAFDEETADNEGLELDLVDQMKDLLLDEEKPDEPKLTKSSVLFDKSSLSTKMKVVLDKLMNVRSKGEKGKRDKCIVVSQWTKMLDIVAHHLTEARIKYSIIQGNIPAKKRMEVVEEFNTNPHGAEVMLVSLRAGGVGLNLIGGNHLFLLDQHWNPALEDQACDRIYRVGQKKDVFIHRFLCKDTVEEKIVELQKRKQNLAENVLSGGGVTSTKLTLADLRMIFGV